MLNDEALSLASKRGHLLNICVLHQCEPVENNNLKPLTDFLESIGISKLRIASVLLLFPPIMLSDVETDIKPRIHEWEKILTLRCLLEPLRFVVT